MKIIDGYCDYSWNGELETLMVKMANLSKYKPILFDSMVPNKHELELFEKKVEHYDLFLAGLLFIFSENVYLKRMPDAFKNLTHQQQSNFYKYYNSFKKEAMRHGFFSEYNLIRIQIEPFQWLSLIAEMTCFLFIWYAVDYFLIAALIFSFWNRLTDIKLKLDCNQEQLYHIVQKLNKATISKNIDLAKKQLIEAGWLDSEGTIVI